MLTGFPYQFEDVLYFEANTVQKAVRIADFQKTRLATLYLFRVLKVGVLRFQGEHETVVISFHDIVLKNDIIQLSAAFAH